MNRELTNIIEVMDFLENNNIEKDVPATSFDGLVEYKSPKGDIKGKAEIRVTLKGYGEEGKIDILGNDFDPFNVHVQFKAIYQTYKYDKNDKKLKICGESDKMQGNYEVTISV